MKVNEKVQMKVDEIGMHFVLSLKNMVGHRPVYSLIQIMKNRDFFTFRVGPFFGLI